jgi:hypothetical protein
MELLELKNNILDFFTGDTNELDKIIDVIKNDKAIFPFNEYEYLLQEFINKKYLSFEDYLNIRQDYINANPNLWIFEISAPRSFGEKFAQTYLMGMCSSLKKPSKKIDKNYTSEYDLYLEDKTLGGIKIEVKASRAVDASSNEPLYMKALSSNTKQNFLMNFQQLKPNYCDVFIWVAVFRDKILVWVIPAKDVLNHSLYSKGQHRGNHGNEGQLHMNNSNIKQFNKYLLKNKILKRSIVSAFKKNNQ